MGEKTGHAIWSQLDRLDVSPTEALVLLTLAHYGIDDLPLCHPRQRQISRKTHLGLTAVKSPSLSSDRRDSSAGRPSPPAGTTTRSSSCNRTGARTVPIQKALQDASFEGFSSTAIVANLRIFSSNRIRAMCSWYFTLSPSLTMRRYCTARELYR